MTRVYTEELEKFRRYAFGAAEAILNPISEWETRGVVKESWRRFCHSEHVRWYQVVDLLQFFFSLVNLASLVPIAISTGLGFIHPYRALSMMSCRSIVFGLVPIPAILHAAAPRRARRPCRRAGCGRRASALEGDRRPDRPLVHVRRACRSPSLAGRIGPPVQSPDRASARRTPTTSVGLRAAHTCANPPCEARLMTHSRFSCFAQG